MQWAGEKKWSLGEMDLGAMLLSCGLSMMLLLIEVPTHLLFGGCTKQKCNKQPVEVSALRATLGARNMAANNPGTRTLSLGLAPTGSRASGTVCSNPQEKSGRLHISEFLPFIQNIYIWTRIPPILRPYYLPEVRERYN